MPRFQRDGIDIHYEREGQGVPLLALAGMASDSASWLPIAGGLSARFDLIRPDARCTGQTRPMPCAVSPGALRDDTLALLDHCGIDRCAAVGHSLGAMAALDLAAAAPDRVTRLVVMSSTGQTSAQARQLFAELSALYRELAPQRYFALLFHWLFAPQFFDQPASLEAAIDAACAYPHRQPPEALETQRQLLDAFAKPPHLSALSCPVLVLSGIEDRLVPPRAVASAFADTGARIEFIPGAAHSLHWDQPEATLRRLLSFLGESA